MKFLLDENIPMSFQKELKKYGYRDIKSINDFAKGLPDKGVYEVTLKEKRILVTIDRDFFAYKNKESYGIISISGKLVNPCKALHETLQQIGLDDRLPSDLINSFVRITNGKFYITYRKKSKVKETLYRFKNKN